MVANLYAYALPTSMKKWPIRKGLLLEWNGGWGEIAPLPGVSVETLEEAREEILSLLPNLSTAKPKCPSVQFGIQAASTPFPSTPLRLPLCLLDRPHKGFSSLKIKVGHLSIDEAIASVSQYLGSYQIRLDCNQCWTLDEALYFARHFSPDDFDYLEEPVQTFEELVHFSELTGFHIAVDESIREPLLQIPTLKAIVYKPTVVGYLPLIPPEIPIVLSSSYESSLGLLQIARFAAFSAKPLGLDTFRVFQEDLLIPPLSAKDGYLFWTPTNHFPIDRSKLSHIASA